MRASYIENLPAEPAKKAGQREFPPEHPTTGSLLRLFPDPAREFRAAKELRPDHFSCCLDHSFGPSRTTIKQLLR
jgi:hypothetical protein